jgi:hypothetical protein
MATSGSISTAAESISALYRDYLMPMSPGSMIHDLLQASFDPEVQAPRVAEIIEKDPLYCHYLQKLDILQQKIAQWREDFPEDRSSTARLTQFIVILLGPAAVRNAVLSVWINRHAGQGLPRKKDVPFLVIPRTVLRYALSISDYCEGQQIANADTAYLGGLCFDWVAALLEKKGGSAKSEKKYLEETWPEAVKTARLAYELASLPKRMALGRFAFPAALLISLGKVLSAASFPKKPTGGMGWKEFVKHCESYGPKASLVYQLLEPERFAWTHAEAAALCAQTFPQLQPAASAIRSYLEPSVLQGLAPDAYELALLLSVATTLTQYGKTALSATQKEGLERLGITDAALTAVLNRGSKR